MTFITSFVPSNVCFWQWKVSRLRDCDLPLPEAVMFVCVHVCQHLLYYVLSYILWQRFHQNAMIRLRLLVATTLTE